MVAAKRVELPGAADALEGGVEPQGQEDLGVDRGAPGPPSTALMRSYRGLRSSPST